jgi:hypothetical protein
MAAIREFMTFLRVAVRVVTYILHKDVMNFLFFRYCT